MEGSTEHRVEVSGTAKREVPPDRAGWLVQVTERDTDERAVFERCTERLNAVTAALRDALGDEGQVTTQGIGIGPWYEGTQERGLQGAGAVQVSAPIAQAGEVARVAMDAGGDRIHGPWFAVNDPDAHREELIAGAVEAARRKAELAAAAAGRRVGAAIHIDEHVIDYHHMGHGSAIHGAAMGTPEVQPQDQTLSTTVRVTFELVD